MKYPEILKEFLENIKPSSTPLRYAETIEFKNNEFITHLWAIKYHKDFEKPLVKEVFRESESKKWINTDFYFCGLGGWRVAFDKKRSNYYGTIEPKNKMVEYDGQNAGIEKTILYSLKDIKNLDSNLKYMTVHNFSTLYTIIDFIKCYRTHPELEILAKMNVEYMFTDSRVFKLKGKIKNDFIKWIHDQQQYIINNRPNYLFIRGCLKENMSPEEYNDFLKLKQYRSQLKSLKTDFEVKEMLKLQEYLKTNKIVLETYIEYLNKAKKIGKEIKETCVKYPKNFQKISNEINKLYDLYLDNQEKERLENLLKQKESIFNFIKDFSKNDKMFDVKILYKPSELIEVGEEMHNCLSTYVEKVSNSECIVFAFFEKEKPVEACELELKKKKLKLVQLRGKYNQDTMWHEHCLKQVNNLISAYGG